MTAALKTMLPDGVAEVWIRGSGRERDKKERERGEWGGLTLSGWSESAVSAAFCYASVGLEVQRTASLPLVKHLNFLV